MNSKLLSGILVTIALVLSVAAIISYEYLNQDPRDSDFKDYANLTKTENQHLWDW